MRILHFESFFHPDTGYQLNILAKHMKKKGNDVAIVTGEIEKFPDYLCSFFGKKNIEERDKEYTQKYGVEITRVPVDWYHLRQAYINRKYLGIISQYKPDVVFAHANDDLNSMRLIKYCIKKNIPVVSDSHMVEVASVSHFSWAFKLFYRLFFTPAILKNKIYVIKTANVDYVNKHYHLDEAYTPWISFGSDTMLFHPDSVMRREIRHELGISETAMVGIYAGKIDEFKGGLFLAEGLTQRFTKDVVFIIIGNAVGEYGAKVEKILSESENIIIRLPTQKYEHLSRFFQAADFAVIPRQTSLTFYDYQATGLPVISENIEINDERTRFNNGFLFEKGSVEQFRNAIEKYINMEETDRQSMQESAIKYINESFNYEEKCDEYMEILEKTVNISRSMENI